MFTAELNAKDQAAELRWQFKATLITRTIFDYQSFFFFFCAVHKLMIMECGLGNLPIQKKSISEVRN